MVDNENLITLYMTSREDKTFGFDYSQEGAILSGETVDPDQPMEVFVDPSGPTLGTPEPVLVDFKDSDGKIIRPGRGVRVRITAPNSISEVTTYTVVCRARATGGDKLESGGKLVVTPTIGS